jgi:hypothetical protein
MYSIQRYNGAWVTLPTANLEGVSVTKGKEQDRIFARVSVDGTIKFYGSDYDTLISLISSLKIQARILRDSTVIATGYLNLLGKWDADNSVCELGFDVVDAYTPILKLWDEDVNLSGLTYNQVILEVDSETKTVTFDRSIVHDAPTPENNYTEGTHTAELWVFVKELIQFPADGWTYDRSGTGDNDPWIMYEGYSKAVDGTQTVQRTFNRFYEIEDVLNRLVTESDGNFDASEFSDYLGDDSELTYLLLAAKKQIKDENEYIKDKSLTLSGVLSLMKNLFNLDWFLDADDSDNLKFKHPSEISLSLPNLTTWPAHDLTDFEDLNWSLQKKVYDYQTDLPFKEKWTVERSRQEDFDGLPIRYDVETEQSIEYDISKFQNNIQAILNSVGDNDAGDISDSGFCMVAVNTSDKIISKTGILSGESVINGKLALSQLHEDHFIEGGRYFSTGTINGSSETFTNTKRIKQIVELKAPVNIDDFDFDALVKTSLGNGELISVSEPLNEGYATIKIIL